MLENKSSNIVKHINATTIGYGQQAQIALSLNTILYIVPKGKKFKGYIWSSPLVDGSQSYFTINGQPYPLNSDANSYANQAKVYLEENDVIGFSGSYYTQTQIVSLTGVEF
jgi:hypothetical protein